MSSLVRRPLIPQAHSCIVIPAYWRHRGHRLWKIHSGQTPRTGRQVKSGDQAGRLMTTMPRRSPHLAFPRLQLGNAVVDCDKLGHLAYEPGTPGYAQVALQINRG